MRYADLAAWLFAGCVAQSAAPASRRYGRLVAPASCRCRRPASARAFGVSTGCAALHPRLRARAPFGAGSSNHRTKDPADRVTNPPSHAHLGVEASALAYCTTLSELVNNQDNVMALSHEPKPVVTQTQRKGPQIRGCGAVEEVVNSPWYRHCHATQTASGRSGQSVGRCRRSSSTAPLSLIML